MGTNKADAYLNGISKVNGVASRVDARSTENGTTKLWAQNVKNTASIHQIKEGKGQKTAYPRLWIRETFTPPSEVYPEMLR